MKAEGTVLRFLVGFCLLTFVALPHFLAADEFSEKLNLAAQKSELKKLANSPGIGDEILNQLATKWSGLPRENFCDLMYFFFKSQGIKAEKVYQQAFLSKDSEIAIAAILTTTELDDATKRQWLEPIVRGKVYSDEVKLEAADILGASKDPIAREFLYNLVCTKESFLLPNKTKFPDALARFEDPESLRKLLDKNLSRWARETIWMAILIADARVFKLKPDELAESMEGLTHCEFKEVSDKAGKVLVYRFQHPKNDAEKNAMRGALEKMAQDPTYQYRRQIREMLGN